MTKNIKKFKTNTIIIEEIKPRNLIALAHLKSGKKAGAHTSKKEQRKNIRRVENLNLKKYM